MLGWVEDIERATLENENFRTVLHTGERVQLTVMRLQPGEDIGRERHPHTDQFLRIESGTGRVEFGRSEEEVDETHDVGDDWAIIVPAGVWHRKPRTTADRFVPSVPRPSVRLCSCGRKPPERSAGYL
jgi:mannose-6-phosphate isomerase-like protein (cupin superfamily)